jgi:hypothetical protein
MITTSFRRAVCVASVIAASAVIAVPDAAFASVPSTPDVTAQAAGTVYALAQAGDRTIVGGSFLRFGGKARSNVAGVLPDGTVDPTFNPGADGIVYAAAVSTDGATVFLGGTFTTAGGAARANLVAVDAVTGAAIAGWQADTTGAYPDVKSLAVSGNVLYVGGRYTGIDGSTRKRLVALDASTGDLISGFKPAPSGNVREVVVSPDGTKVYAGGAFTTIGGQTRANAAAELNADTGLATAFDPSVGGGNVVTIELTPDGSRFFFSTENNTVFAYDLGVSNDPVWSRKMSGNTQAMAASDTGELYIGGHFASDLGTKLKRPFFASIWVDSGNLTSWAPDATGGKMGVWAFEIDGNHVYAGGIFKYFNGVKQQGFARFTGTP